VTFLHAGILAAGLAAVSIPILIHLLMRRRRQPVLWGAMRFLEEAIRRTRRRLLLERWLLLAARCLLIAIAAIALGRPLLDALAPGSRGGMTVILLIDNGLAGQALTADGVSALDRHRAAARNVLAELSEGDRVGIIALGGPAAAIVAPPTANLSAAAGFLDNLTPTDARTDLPGGLALAAGAIGGSGDQPVRADRAVVVLLSDFSPGSADREASLPKLPSGVRLVASLPPEQGPAGNVAIRELRAVRSVLLAGRGEAGQTISMQLIRSGPEVASAGRTGVTARLQTAPSPGAAAPAGQPSRGEVRWTAGQREASVTLVLDAPPASTSQPAVLLGALDADALPGDNTFRLPVEVREVLRVGVLAGPRGSGSGPESLTTAQWLRLALRPREDASIEVADLDPSGLDPATLANFDAIVIADPQRLAESDWPRLRQFAEGAGGLSGAGGLLLIFPPADRLVHTWTDAMVRGLDLPVEFARESRDLTDAQGGLPRLRADAPPAAEGVIDLLAPIRGELPELVPPVAIRRVLPISTSTGAVPVLSLSDGTGVVWTINPGRESGGERSGAPERSARATRSTGGAVVYVAFALDLSWTDLPVKPLVVPLMQELIRQGVGRARPGGWTRAGGRPEPPAQAVRLVPWPGEGASRDELPLNDSGRTAAPLRSAGVWDAIDTRGGRRAVLAVNADPLGSNLDAPDLAAVQAWLTSGVGVEGLTWLAADRATGPTLPPDAARAERVSAAFESAPMARAAGPALLWAALLLALVEVFLARRASHAAFST
jgi:hypothetical protein